jgi:hypothetical protein
MFCFSVAHWSSKLHEHSRVLAHLLSWKRTGRCTTKCNGTLMLILLFLLLWNRTSVVYPPPLAILYCLGLMASQPYNPRQGPWYPRPLSNLLALPIWPTLPWSQIKALKLSSWALPTPNQHPSQTRAANWTSRTL